MGGGASVPPPLSFRVTGANEIAVEATNASAGTVDPASANADFYVAKANGGLTEVAAATDLSGFTAVRFIAFGL